MFEKLCALLIRLYPAGFRQRYGDEALRLLMDRARDEKGVLRQLRLGLDLIRDLIATPRMYGPRTPISQLSHAPGGELSFQPVGRESPAASSLFMGFLVSLILLGVLPVGFVGSGSGTWNFPRRPVVAQVPPERAQPQHAPLTQASAKIDAAKRHDLIQEIGANLKEHYVDPAAAKKMAEALQTNEINGVYDTIADGGDLASLLTRHLREVSGDLHIDVVYSERPLPNGPPPAPSAEALDRYKTAMLRQNCTVEKAQMLPGNIGYLKFNFFPDTTRARTLRRLL